MSKLIIWGRSDSSNVQKVLWCCKELKLNFERIDLGGGFGGNKEKDYLKLNPNGLVPTLQDGEFTLWESNSILRYLVEQYGHDSTLAPFSLKNRAYANQWMDWQLSAMSPTMGPLFLQLTRTPLAQQNASIIEKHLAETIRLWEIVDRYLESSSYLAGNDFSIADIPLGIWAYRWFNLPSNLLPIMGNLSRWYQDLCQRPAYQECIMGSSIQSESSEKMSYSLPSISTNPISYFSSPVNSAAHEAKMAPQFGPQRDFIRENKK